MTTSPRRKSLLNKTLRGLCFVSSVLLFSGLPLTSLGQALEETIFVIGTRTEVPDPLKIFSVYNVPNYALQQRGIGMKMSRIPTRRMTYALKDGLIDGFIVARGDNSATDGLIMAKHPISILQARLYYKKSSKLNPVWPPDQAFQKAKGTSQMMPYVESRYGLDISLVRSARSGVLMVNSDRADYLIDPIPLPVKEMALDNPDIVFEDLFSDPIVLWLADSPKGRRFKAILDEETTKLHQNKEAFRTVWLRDRPADFPTESLDRLLNHIESLQQKADSIE